ncbi:MAG: choice-of-anchor U domain-containing protein [Dehalococcoidia bacterium]|jgi:hypothetical protein
MKSSRDIDIAYSIAYIKALHFTSGCFMSSMKESRNNLFNVVQIIFCCLLILIVSGIFVGPAAVRAVGLTTVYVNGAAGDDSYDGSSATHTGGTAGPKKTIAAGISVVSASGTVNASPGTYHEHDLILPRNMTLSGAGALSTVIDGDGLGTVVQGGSGSGGFNIVISGFTIINGASTQNDIGGAIYDYDSIVTVNDCALVGNQSYFGGGLTNFFGHTILNRCTVSNNICSGKAGGVLNIGALGSSTAGVLDMTNCTVYGNQTTGGPPSAGGVYNSTGTVNLVNSTIVGNGVADHINSAGGFYNEPGNAYFLNTIIAGNISATIGHNNGYTMLANRMHSKGYNIDSENSCYFTQSTDQINTNPLLGPLQNNGGQTSTMAITTDSPAFNKGTNIGAPATDQRGITRPQAANCDIGAYELLILDVKTTSVNTSLGPVNFTTSAGSISGLTNLPPGSMPCSAGGFIFPYGMFSYSITNLASGATATVTITTPTAVSLGSKVFKCQNGNLTDFSQYVQQPDPNTFILTLKDGGQGDADGQANGAIVDPCGMALPISGPPHSSSAQVPILAQGPMAIANITVESASLSTAKVALGATVTVTADIANKGTANGSAQIKLYVNGQEEAHQGVTLSSGSLTPVKFTVSRDEPGTYSVYVGNIPAGTFEVDQFAAPNLILYISGALLLFALAGGVIFMASRRRQR